MLPPPLMAWTFVIEVCVDEQCVRDDAKGREGQGRWEGTGNWVTLETQRRCSVMASALSSIALTQGRAVELSAGLESKTRQYRVVM